MSIKRNLFKRFHPDASIPTLAWLVAKRVTDPLIELDCTIMVTGPKGSGKSTLCVGLAYDISKAIAVIKNRNKLSKLNNNDRDIKVIEYASKYFNMEHIKSVDREGTMEMFSGDIIKIENSILLCDDLSISANSRDAMTKNNKILSKIMTVSRPFRNVIILNTVYSSLVDKVARGFADIQIEMVGIDKKRRQGIMKVFLHHTNQTSGKEYRKYFKFDGKRVVYWVSYLPPKKLLKSYKELRMKKTKEMIDAIKDERDEAKQKGTKRDRKSEAIMDKWKVEVIKRYQKGDSIKSMTRLDPELTEYYVNKIIANSNQPFRTSNEDLEP
jgi:uridine kinase